MQNKPETPRERAQYIKTRIPAGGLFSEMDWRIAPYPFKLDRRALRELEFLGRVLLKFYLAVNALYRRSVEGKEPGWVADLLDAGKPQCLIDLQRSAAFKNDIPRIIRPDLLPVDDGFILTELDSVPGGIGLTAWMNEVYESLGDNVVGGPTGMMSGFSNVFGDAERVWIVVSEEASTYRPEMRWLSERLGAGRFKVVGSDFNGFSEGDAVYRFFELFDLDNIECWGRVVESALFNKIILTPPPKPVFEEKALFALLWNGRLREFWRRELGEKFFRKMQGIVPYSWIIDPSPMPPHAAVPRLEITDWDELRDFSQKRRNLILKISGFSERAWGARGVFLGSDISRREWSDAIDHALESFGDSPWILQEYHKPKRVRSEWYDFEDARLVEMQGRARLCPYYFVEGGDGNYREVLSGVLATVCPPDKKIIHGMSDALMAPVSMDE
ncbi:MAG: hypothetical protein K9N48_05400 [Verrucomicrobia bacterium]|nr:hypothetical protein [Verrucomicrobiota bacterium]MCF7707473.1 hypothetical protein [Verrucomicrobiota bacterium]